MSKGIVKQSYVQVDYAEYLLLSHKQPPIATELMIYLNKRIDWFQYKRYHNGRLGSIV